MGQTPSEFVIDEELIPLGIPTQAEYLWEQLNALIVRCAELTEKLQRAEQKEERKRRQLLLNLLEVTDAFERIFRDTDLAELDEVTRSRLRSVRVTSTLLENVLEEEDVIAMDGLEGHPFDPYIQDVATIEMDTDKPNNSVLEVREKGYRWQGRVLRKAKVVVSRTAKEKSHGKNYRH